MKKFFKRGIFMLFSQVFEKDLEELFDDCPELQIKWSDLLRKLL